MIELFSHSIFFYRPKFINFRMPIAVATHGDDARTMLNHGKNIYHAMTLLVHDANYSKCEMSKPRHVFMRMGHDEWNGRNAERRRGGRWKAVMEIKRKCLKFRRNPICTKNIYKMGQLDVSRNTMHFGIGIDVSMMFCI